MEYQQDEAPKTAIPTAHPSRIFPVPRLSTLITILIVGFLIYAYFAGLTKQFYASLVFSFYALTKSMWISVIMLGITQTILLIPFRVVSLIKGTNLKEFEVTIKRLEAEKVQAGFLKQSIKGGRSVALYYIVNFFVQVISYVSIGRLFLTDFYSVRLDPWLLYKFVPYPEYPIQDRWFKIPYLWFKDFKDLGMHWVWIVWLVIVGVQAALLIYRTLSKRVKALNQGTNSSLGRLTTAMTGSTVLFLFLSWLLIRHFPIHWTFRIFSGDVAFNNPRFNTITAIVTAVTLIWMNLPKINKKVDLARKAGISPEVIKKTEINMFKETVQTAVLLGLGAFYITNMIPCAFELSVFTLELISLLSPLTLDRLILATVKARKSDKIDEGKKPEDKVVEIQAKPKLEGEIQF